MGVLAALAGGRTRGAAPCAALLLAACLPRDDLASYSSSSGVGGSDAGAPSSMQNDAGPLGQGGGEPDPDPMLPLDPGEADASAGGGDAGVGTAPDAGLPDAGPAPVDAGPIANECTRLGGSLESGTSVCLIVASAARVTWQAAALNCQTRGATLVSIESSARDDFLTTLIDSDVWVGGNDPGVNPAANAFVWRDGTTVQPINWAAMEPDAVADQFCIAKTAEPDGPWRDRPCSELKAYVCEQAL